MREADRPERSEEERAVLNRLRGLYIRYAAHHRQREEDASADSVRSAVPIPLRFAADLTRALPAILAFFATKDPVWRARVKARLHLNITPVALPMDARLFEGPADLARATAKAGVTIVLPVYNAFHLLPDVLNRVENHTDVPWHLIIIEDRSTDPEIRPFLREWAASRKAQVTVIENAENLGFIGSVNKGLSLALPRGQHVILLNSDAFVPQDWAGRLLAPILRDASVASVTPMSNDAELMSVPEICQRTDLRVGEGDMLDAYARQFSPVHILPDAPTGVGFCMAMNLAFLRQLPEFDPAFGRGYGEEVDWCQKAQALGGLHICLPGLFVEHRGGESFGSADKQALLMKNGAILSGRYPEFDREVQDFIRNDALVTPRLALALALLDARAETPVPIYLAHSLGGGAEHFLQALIAADLAQGRASIVLRLGGKDRFQLEICMAEGWVAGTTNDLEFLIRLLDPIRMRRLVYSCAVGDCDPYQVPDLILALCRDEAGDKIEVMFHDFLPVSPSYCLLDQDGKYRGPVSSDRKDPAHIAHRPDGSEVRLADWHAAWGRLLTKAEHVTVFSENSHMQVQAAYPALKDTLRVVPHALLTPIPRFETPDAKHVTIGVLGNIGFQKGAGLLKDLGRQLKGQGQLVLVGNIDPQFSLPASVKIHGDYQRDEIKALAEQYGITCWLIPSIWPETFSYTTHEALATGLPVFAFDIGAQGDAVQRAANGHPIHFAPEADLVQNILKTVQNQRQSKQ